MLPNTKCSNCHKDIYKRPARLKAHKIFFCDRNCQSQHKRKNSKIIIVNCDCCDKRISKNRSQQRNSKTGLFFCNNLCKNKFLAQNRRWQKDDVNSHRQRQNILYDKVKCTCQQCGYNKNKKMLDIHHYDHNHQNNKCDNLRVLCVWCHTKHHRLQEEYTLPVIISFEQMQKEIDIFHMTRERTKSEKPIFLKICEKCKEDFETSNQKQRYCSHICSSFCKRKVQRPEQEKLIQLIKFFPLTTIGKQFGVSDNAVRKWAKGYNLDIKRIKQQVY